MKMIIIILMSCRLKVKKMFNFKWKKRRDFLKTITKNVNNLINGLLDSILINETIDVNQSWSYSFKILMFPFFLDYLQIHCELIRMINMMMIMMVMMMMVMMKRPMTVLLTGQSNWLTIQQMVGYPKWPFNVNLMVIIIN